jgi:hypothetical protein
MDGIYKIDIEGLGFEKLVVFEKKVVGPWLFPKENTP